MPRVKVEFDIWADGDDFWSSKDIEHFLKDGADTWNAEISNINVISVENEED